MELAVSVFMWYFCK